MAAGDCAFCGVIDGSAAAHVVLDDDLVIAFLDRSPVFKGHVLVVPRAHLVTLADVPLDLVGPYFERVQRVSAAMPDALGCDGTFVAMNNVVSQSVAHLHTHVVPRRRTSSAARRSRAGRPCAGDDDAEQFAAPLRAALG
jgi:histidine triad (HIT) family protein